MNKLIFLCIAQLFSIISLCQDEEDSKNKKIKEIPKSTDFSVPNSPAFILLDVTPTKVNKPAFTRDFKLDWVFSGNNLSPNIAIEAQPIWLVFYKDKSFAEYQKESSFAKRLSSLSVSIGTVKKDSIQSLGWGLKLNLWREKNSDPMENKEFIESLKSAISISENEKELWLKLSGKEEELEAASSQADKEKIQKEIEQLNTQLATISESDKQKIKKVKKDFSDKYWNASMIDLGYGNVYNYFGASIDSLQFTQKLSGLWINGSCNFGSKNFLLSGLYKYLGNDTATHFIGLNIRYGSSRINFFGEFVHEKSGNNKKKTIAYGGDFKVSDQLQIQFGIRTEYDKKFNLNSLKPLINLNWLLKNN